MNTALAHELFRYDPVAGKLFNRITRSSRARVDKEAGGYAEGYRTLHFDGKRERSHRVIWEMFKGPIPERMEIDHIAGVKDDNRLSQLRLVTCQEQMANRKIGSSNTSGCMGVFRSRNKWVAEIMVNYKSAYLGSFDKIEDAITARKEAEVKYGFHDNHGRPHSPEGK